MGDLVKSVTSPESALGVPELRKCQQTLESIYILRCLGPRAKPRKVAIKGLATEQVVTSLELYLKLDNDCNKLDEVLVKSLLDAGKVVLTDQQMAEMMREVTRLQHLSSLVISIKEQEDKDICFNPKSTKVLLAMEDLLTDIWRPFNVTQEERWIKLRKELSESMTGLGISEVEKREVVAAMGLGQGHWYSCRNGHVYAIGDCGGATVESTCPECGDTIGGTGHRLTGSNRAAGHMDASSAGNYQWGLGQGQFQG